MVVADDSADEASAPPPMPLERNAPALLRAAAMAVAATVACDDIVRNGAARFVASVVLVLAQPPTPRLRRDTASAAADEVPRSPRCSPPQRSDPALRSRSPPTLCSRRRAALAAAAVSRLWSHARPRSQSPNRCLQGCDVAWAVGLHGQCASAASRRRKTPLGVFLGAYWTSETHHNQPPIAFTSPCLGPFPSCFKKERAEVDRPGVSIPGRSTQPTTLRAPQAKHKAHP